MAKKQAVKSRVEMTPEEYKQAVRNGWSEADFIKEVLALAKRNRWRSAHFRPAMLAKGKWVTAVQGDGKGFPDLILLRRGEMLAVELKVGRNPASEEQHQWLDAFHWIAGVEVAIWRPSDWPEIELVLA